MELELPQLTVFKYKHGDRILLTRQRKFYFVVIAFFSMVLTKLFFPLGLLALILPASVYLGGVRIMSLGPRYLICGDHILYYANVTEINVSEAEGILRIRTGGKSEFEIDRARFLTSARKKEAAANKAADFNKVTAMIVERARLLSPSVTGNAIPVAPEVEPDLQAEASS
jgi:hypothetical protein